MTFKTAPRDNPPRAEGAERALARAGPTAATRLSPRIYALNPALAGDPGVWREHLARIADMGFDWLLINGAGLRRPHGAPEVRLDGPFDAPKGFGKFATDARGKDLKIMVDLMPVLAADAKAAERRSWLAQADRARLGDGLTEADPRNVEDRPPLVSDLSERKTDREVSDHLADAIEKALKAGVTGFRCRFAHLLPAAFWHGLFTRIRKKKAGQSALFLADSLGAPFERTAALKGAGFDLVFNSGCWWDFTSDWLLDQLDALRDVAPTVTFPESPDGPPLAEGLADLGSDEMEAAHRSRYLFAASLSAGVLMPMGFEFGLPREARREEDGANVWEHERARRRFDMSGFIAKANRLKSEWSALSGEGRLTRLSAPGAPALVLQRLDAALGAEAQSAAVLCFNPGPEPVRPLGVERALLAAGGGFSEFTPALDTDGGTDRLLQPFAARLTRAEREPLVTETPKRAQSQKALQELAEERLIIERVEPAVDDGRFAVKRLIGDEVAVSADIFSDGHEVISGVVRLLAPGARKWTETQLVHQGNDVWSADIRLEHLGLHQFVIEAWRDAYASWRRGTEIKHAAGQDVELEVEEGLRLVAAAREQAKGPGKKALAKLQESLEAEENAGGRLGLLLAEETVDIMARHGPRPHARSTAPYPIRVERRLAGIGAWYELVPRSQSGSPERHGTFDDVIERLPYIRSLGFDVLYMPPIHPIGRTHRKGRNNSLTPGPDDPGSLYAIGAEEGGHKALHPELGDFDDFARLVEAARAHGLEIAIDFAIQCSPDHPWIKQHPEWFDWRPDGTIKYAENPPKKYEDIVNVHFYRKALPSIWFELRDTVLFWADKGVKIFRVDNPHTKPVPFWEWMIGEVQARHPDTVFLSEAFTRPKMMKRLAKVGFTQSYSYFTWRNTKQELAEYLTELTQEDCRLYMRPNFFANTPDINPYYLQTSGRAGFQARLVLAATLATSYGIYNGFELCEAAALPGREEYLDSEKYEIRAWDWDRPGNIREDVALINRMRRENPALWGFENLAFLNAWNDNILAYYKLTGARDNCVVIAVNLDPHNAQTCNFEIPLWEFGLPDDAAIAVDNLITGERLSWHGKVQSVTLDPAHRAYAIWRLLPPGYAS